MSFTGSSAPPTVSCFWRQGFLVVISAGGWLVGAWYVEDKEPLEWLATDWTQF